MTRDFCYLCLRVDSNRFYKELRDFGFDGKQAQFTIGLIRKAYEADASLCSGKRTSVLKATFAYIGGLASDVMFRYDDSLHRITIRDCRVKFNVTDQSIGRNYRRLARLLGLKEDLDARRKHIATSSVYLIERLAAAYTRLHYVENDLLDALARDNELNAHVKMWIKTRPHGPNLSAYQSTELQIARWLSDKL